MKRSLIGLILVLIAGTSFAVDWEQVSRPIYISASVSNGNRSLVADDSILVKTYLRTGLGIITRRVYSDSQYVRVGGDSLRFFSPVAFRSGLTIDGTLNVGTFGDAEIAALAGLTSAADRVPYYTGSGTASLATFTAFGRSLVDDADAATARGTLGMSKTGLDSAIAGITSGSITGLTTFNASGDAGVGAAASASWASLSRFVEISGSIPGIYLTDSGGANQDWALVGNAGVLEFRHETGNGLAMSLNQSGVVTIPTVTGDSLRFVSASKTQGIGNSVTIVSSTGSSGGGTIRLVNGPPDTIAVTFKKIQYANNNQSSYQIKLGCSPANGASGDYTFSVIIRVDHSTAYEGSVKDFLYATLIYCSQPAFSFWTGISGLNVVWGTATVGSSSQSLDASNMITVYITGDFLDVPANGNFSILALQ